MKSSGLSTFTRIVVLCAFYLMGALLGKSSAFLPENVSLIWPPAGIGLAAILLFGNKYWPGVAVGSFLCTFSNGMGITLFTVASALGNTIGALLCAYLLERFVKFDSCMRRVSDVAGFVMLACLLGTTVNALFEVAAINIIMPVAGETLFNEIIDRWFPNALGALIITPIILTWGRECPFRCWRCSRFPEAAACVIGLLATTYISFNSWYVYGVHNYPLAFLPYPFLAWSALRFGQRGASAATLLVSSFALWSLLQGQGPFVTDRVQTSLILLGCYIGFLAVTNMLLAAVVSEKEAALEKAEQAQQRYRTVVEDQTDLICRFDRNGRFTFVNGAFCRFHEKTFSDFRDSNVERSCLGRSRKSLLSDLGNLVPSKPSMSFDYPITGIEGSTVWHQCMVRALFDKEGNVLEYQAVIQDVTRRRELEEQERLAAERVRIIMNSMVDGVIVVEENGLISSTNLAAETLFQRKAEQMLNSPVHNLFEQPKQYEAYLSKLPKGGEARVIEIMALRPGNSPIPIDLAASRIIHNGLSVYIFVVRDISERKMMEEQFRQSQKMETIGRLAGGIAHDFNNLMQAMLGYCNLLYHGMGENDSNRDSVKRIQIVVEQARTLTRQLLAFSRKQAPVPRVLTLNTVVSDMHNLLKRLIGETVFIEFELDPQTGCVRAEPGKLEQILLNLSVNARDAMPGGGVLTIKTRATNLPLPIGPKDLPPGPYAVLAVSDTGCGIPKENMDRLFEPFFTTKENDAGIGLGLSIVQDAIKKCGGGITVTSEVEQGTCFEIYLPRIEAEQPEEQKSCDVQTDTKGHETILLVEDEELVLMMLTELLKTEGYTILEAANGALALDVARNHPGKIDLLVTDMSMPSVTGWELAARLEKEGCKIPVLYMSGYSDSDVEEHGKLVNEAGFLQKPFQPAELFALIRRILDGKK